jgi:hypothetical protein
MTVDICKCGRVKDSIWHYFTDKPGPDDLGAHKFIYDYTTEEWREEKLNGRKNTISRRNYHRNT